MMVRMYLMTLACESGLENVRLAGGCGNDTSSATGSGPESSENLRVTSSVVICSSLLCSLGVCRSIGDGGRFPKENPSKSGSTLNVNGEAGNPVECALTSPLELPLKSLRWSMAGLGKNRDMRCDTGVSSMDPVLAHSTGETCALGSCQGGCDELNELRDVSIELVSNIALEISLLRSFHSRLDTSSGNEPRPAKAAPSESVRDSCGNITGDSRCEVDLFHTCDPLGLDVLDQMFAVAGDLRDNPSVLIPFSSPTDLLPNELVRLEIPIPGDGSD
ncbi:hypothetical protein OGAPHI_005341 [Ogataea philodendri]|uniref:Uncharacterized protein n=1 Tax=Ogataea philodendri TaxID=1378263 RepID=A0A9P8T319_9ASCO|nr:uncharacterized protein OGAPHI_005341 [Ogataea philodendri]KAH3663351.1 hypothetical protein OGAPHI_005341 [Ogataea philodendri]